MTTDYPLVALLDAAIAAIALSIAVWEVYVARTRRQPALLWRALVAAAAAAYAALMAAHYGATDAARVVMLTKLEAAAVLTVLLATPPLIASMLNRRLPVALAALVVAPAMLGIALLPTDLLIGLDVNAVTFAWVDRPFLRLVETPQLWVSMALALAAHVVSLAWLHRHRDANPPAADHLMFGAVVWAGVIGAEQGMRVLGVQVPMNMLEYGFLAFAVSLVTDDMRHHIALLNHTEQALDQLIEAASDAIIAVDEQGCVRGVNSVMRATLRLAPEHKLVGYPLHELVEERDHGLLAQLLHDPPGRPGVVRMLRTDGRTAHLEVAVLRPAGHDAQLLLLRDVTARARATAARLEKGRAASMASIGAAVDRRLRGRLHDMVQSAGAAEASEAVADMAEVVEALALFSSRSSDEIGRVSVARPVRAAVALATDLFETRDLRVDVPAGLAVRATVRGLAQAALDVLVYAAGAVGNTAGGPVRVVVRDEVDLVALVVHYTGGIAMRESQQRHFGAELDLCRETVRRMGGRLTVDNDPVEGTTIALVLLRAPGALQRNHTDEHSEGSQPH